MAAEQRKRSYRPHGEVRRLLLRAARELFAARGYEGTTTRAIAEHAGVATSLLHHHFSNKAQLFEEAVFEPFTAYIEQTLAAWDARPPLTRTLEEECRYFVDGLFDILQGNRELVLALAAGDIYETELREFSPDAEAAPITRMLDRLEEATLEATQQAYGWRGDQLRNPSTVA